MIFPRYHQWDAVLKLEADARAARAPGTNYLDPALGRIGQVQHHRLARAPALDACTTTTTTRSSTRSSSSPTAWSWTGSCRTPSTSSSTRTGVVREDRQGLAAARRGAGRASRRGSSSPPCRSSPSCWTRSPTCPPALRGDRRRGALLPDRRGGQGPAAGSRRDRGAGAHRRRGRGRRAARRGSRPGRGGAGQGGRRAAGGSRTSRFFAFTATPKARTLEMFGQLEPGQRQARAVPPVLDAPGHRGGLHPRRARQLHDLPDLLEASRRPSRTTPTYDATKARRAIARFVSLHPHNLAQKAEIIVEHFRDAHRHKIGGQAKAMVVTSSRLHAVRYKQAIDTLHRREGLHRHQDARGLLRQASTTARRARYTEAGMNGFPGVADRRAVRRADEYQVLIVAEKFQTGFDQPLLHTMYVDKKLNGLAAVQTLSRLNRIHPLQGRHLRPRLPQRGRGHRRGVRAVLRPHGRAADRSEHPLRHAAPAGRFRRAPPRRDRGGDARAPRCRPAAEEQRSAEAYAALGPARQRFEALADEEQPGVPRRADRFVRTYSLRVADRRVHRLQARARLHLLPGTGALPARHAATVERLDLGTEVELTHLAIR